MDLATQLQELTPSMLAPLVCQVLGNTSAVVADWSIAPLGGGIGAELGGAVPHRVAGTAREAGTERTWSLVLKVLRMPPSASETFNHLDPGGMFYWKREALLSRSTLLDELPAGFAAPRCYGIDERVDEIWLWFEDLGPPPAVRWSVARYGEAARHLGRYNGAYLTGRPLPEHPWLCRDLLRWRQAIVAPSWDLIAAHPDDARVQRGWPGSVAERAIRVWEERDHWFDVLDRLPHVMCHGDADRRNLFARDTAAATETVAIDWACAGPRAIGTDLVNLVVGSMMWARDREPTELPALDQACGAGYVAGLRSLTEQIDTATSGGKLVFHVFGALT